MLALYPRSPASIDTARNLRRSHEYVICDYSPKVFVLNPWPKFQRMDNYHGLLAVSLVTRSLCHSSLPIANPDPRTSFGALGLQQDRAPTMVRPLTCRALRCKQDVSQV